jgi:hypothetical protein
MVRPLRFILCAVQFAIVLLLSASCNKDDGPDKPDNHITFNGSKLVIKHARLTYDDPADVRARDADIGVTHYSQSMRFTDGDVDTQNDLYIENGTYKLTFSIFTTLTGHTSEFTGGTFSPVHPQDYFGDKAPLDESFYTFFIMRVDDDGNGIFDADETWYDGLEGQIGITGSGNNFTVTIDTSDPGHNMTADGSFKGIFEIIR